MLIRTLRSVGPYAAKMVEERHGEMPWFLVLSNALKALANDGKNAYKGYAREFQKFCEAFPEFQKALRKVEAQQRWARENEKLFDERAHGESTTCDRILLFKVVTRTVSCFADETLSVDGIPTTSGERSQC